MRFLLLNLIILFFFSLCFSQWDSRRITNHIEKSEERTVLVKATETADSLCIDTVVDSSKLEIIQPDSVVVEPVEEKKNIFEIIIEVIVGLLKAIVDLFK